MRKRAIVLLILPLLMSGCETTFNETQSGTLAGSALGAGLGAIIGNQTGHSGVGTAIGAGAGALAGALMGEGIRRAKYQQQAPVYSQEPAPIANYAQVREIHTKFCPTCGRTFAENTRFCPDDGTELRIIQ